MSNMTTLHKGHNRGCNVLAVEQNGPMKLKDTCYNSIDYSSSRNVSSNTSNTVSKSYSRSTTSCDSTNSKGQGYFATMRKGSTQLTPSKKDRSIIQRTGLHSMWLERPKIRSKICQKLALNSSQTIFLLLPLAILAGLIQLNGIAGLPTGMNICSQIVTSGGESFSNQPYPLSWNKFDGQQEKSEVQHFLIYLLCNVKPIVANFKQLTMKTKNIDLISLDKTPNGDIWRDYDKFLNEIDNFYDEANQIVGRRDNCNFPTIFRLKNLRIQATGSKILEQAFDIVAIEYHSHCMFSSLEMLPLVPNIVRDVVKIYIDGAGEPIPDLNKPTSNEAEREFDVDQAIAKNGPLESVVQLILTIPSESSGDRVQDFRTSCRNFVLEIEQRWQSMDLMGETLATTANTIATFNNYIVRSLVPTKFADICSRLTAQA